MRLLIFKTRLPAFEPVDKSCRKWLSEYKRAVGVDKSIAKYVQHASGGRIRVDYKDPFQVDLSSYDKVFIGFEYWSIAHVLQDKGVKGMNAYKQLLQSVPKSKMLVPYPFIRDAFDKCKMSKIMKKLNIGAAPTVCIKLSKSMDIRRAYNLIQKQKWDRVFIKPIPGESTHDVFNPEVLEYDDFKQYVRTLLKKNIYEHMVCQRFMRNFATDRHPEMRTFWTGSTYVTGVKTTSAGYYKGAITRLPAEIRRNTQKIIRYFESVYKFDFVSARFDWGYDNGSYFFNEMELLPGFFNEEMDDSVRKCTWQLDRQIGERIIRLVS